MNELLGSLSENIKFFDITITILDFTHSPVFYLKLNVSRTGFCLLFRWNSLSWAQQIEISSVSEFEEREQLYPLGPTE
jgi:hypothetical protein